MPRVRCTRSSCCFSLAAAFLPSSHSHTNWFVSHPGLKEICMNRRGTGRIFQSKENIRSQIGQVPRLHCNHTAIRTTRPDLVVFWLLLLSDLSQEWIPSILDFFFSFKESAVERWEEMRGGEWRTAKDFAVHGSPLAPFHQDTPVWPHSLKKTKQNATAKSYKSNFLYKSVKPTQQHCFPWPETFYVVHLFCKVRSDHNAGKIEITRALINTSRWGEGLLSNAIIQIIHLDMDYMIITGVNWVSDLAWEKKKPSIEV